MTVIVKEDDSVYDIGKNLKAKGLIEDPVIFWAQEKLSDYSGKIKPGTYLLNTYENVNQMLSVLSGENTEGQPSQENSEKEESQEDSQE